MKDLMELIGRLEMEENVPANKKAKYTELADAVEKLDTMCRISESEEPIPAELAERMFNATGKRRNYGQERRAIIKFGDELERQLVEYFKEAT